MANYLAYLPEPMQVFEEFGALAKAEDEAFNTIRELLQKLYGEQYIDSASEIGVKKWEKILNVSAKDTESLLDRKFRVLARLNEKLPYTEETLNQKLKTLCGENGYTMVMNYGDYRLVIRVALAAKNMVKEVESFVRRVTPANISLDISLLYNQHSTLKTKRNGELKLFTHEKLRNEVI